MCAHIKGDKVFTKILRMIALIICLNLLILSSINVSAEILQDSMDDVWYSEKNQEGWTWNLYNITNHSNIDIISVEYFIEDSELTLTMVLKDKINISRYAGYEIYYGNFSDIPYYRVQYLTYNDGTYRSFGFDDDFKGEIVNPILEDGKTFSATFEINHMDSTFEIWGYAFEYNDDRTIYWADFVPLKYEPVGDVVNDSNGDDLDNGDDGSNLTDDDSDDIINNDNTTNDDMTNGDKDGKEQEETPGFGIIIVICAIALIVLRKRKRI